MADDTLLVRILSLLLDWDDHLHECRSLNGGACTCGYDQMQAALQTIPVPLMARALMLPEEQKHG